MGSSDVPEPRQSNLGFGLSIEVAGPGDEVAVWIFDPKYKLVSATVPAATAGDDQTDASQPPGLPKRLDLDAMHAYRDAIRVPDGEPVVRYARPSTPAKPRTTTTA